MNVAVLVTETETQPICRPLVMDRPIGNGKYSIYHLQTMKKDFECALKIFPKTKEAYVAYYRESKVLASLAHENIISFIPNIRFNTQAFDCYFLAMEYAPFGDFFDLIFSQELHNEKLVRTYFHQLVSAVEYLHSKGIAHLDIKLENLLLGEDYLLKLADFDQSQLLDEKNLLSRGSPSFRALEVIKGECKDFAAADVYSMGIILYALATGDFPFLEKEDDESGFSLAHYDLFCGNSEAFWELRVGQRADKNMFDDSFKELMAGLVAKDPVKRWNIKEVKASRWYKGDTLSSEELKEIMKDILKKTAVENDENNNGVNHPIDNSEPLAPKA